MTRVVDRAHRGSFQPNTATLGSFRVTIGTVNCPQFTDKASMGGYFKVPPSPESVFNAYPSIGIAKINAGVEGFTAQRSGSGGVAKGSPFVRVDCNSIQVTTNPTVQPGVPSIGSPIGWYHYAWTIDNGIVKVYFNGRPASTNTYVHTGNGINASLSDLTFICDWANGYNGSPHRCATAEFTLSNEVFTADEVADWYFKGQPPSRGIVGHYLADEFIGTASSILDRSGQNTRPDLIVSINKCLEVPS